LTFCSRFSVSSEAGFYWLNAVLLAWTGFFTHVHQSLKWVLTSATCGVWWVLFFYCIKDWCRSPGDGDCLGYGDRPKHGAVFCLHRTIYTLGVLWIKPGGVGLGQLCICTCNPCRGEGKDGVRANCLQQHCGDQGWSGSAM